jgi:hypothetical protein
MRAATLWLWTAIFWAGSGSQVLGQEWQSPLRHLPDNTLAVVHIRVEALLKSEWGKSALEELLKKKDIKESFAKLKSDLGIDPFEIESLTLLVLDPVLSGEQLARPFNLHRPPPPPPIILPPSAQFNSYRTPPLKVSPPANIEAEFVSVAAQAGRNEDPLPLAIVTARKAIDRMQFLRKQANLEGAAQSRIGLLFLSDHSFAAGSSHSISQFAANTSDKESELGRQLTQDNSQTMIQGGYRLTAELKKAIPAEFGGAGMLTSAIPLLNVTRATFTLDLGKPADLKLRLQAASERQANLAAESAKTLLAWGETKCETYVAELEKQAREAADAKATDEVRAAIALTKAARQMASTARVEQRHTEVSVALQIEIHPKQVVSHLYELLRWDTSPKLTSSH